MKPLLTVLAITLGGASLTAFAQAPTSAIQNCTPDVIEKKAQELADRVAELSKRDPERAAQLNEEIKQMNIKRTQRTLGNECQAYEQRIEDLEKAERQADMPAADSQKNAQ